MSHPPWLRETAAGVLVLLHLQPGARRTVLVGEHGGRLKIAVQAPPVQGRANEAVVEWLAERLDVKRQDIRITSGQQSRDKTLLVAGIRAGHALALLLQK
jgi:hypothetical protein